MLTNLTQTRSATIRPACFGIEESWQTCCRAEGQTPQTHPSYRSRSRHHPFPCVPEPQNPSSHCRAHHSHSLHRPICTTLSSAELVRCVGNPNAISLKCYRPPQLNNARQCNTIDLGRDSSKHWGLLIRRHEVARKEETQLMSHSTASCIVDSVVRILSSPQSPWA